MDARKQLEEMGFAPKRIEAAMRNTSGELEAAVEWIEANQERFDKADAQEYEDLDETETHPAAKKYATIVPATTETPEEEKKPLTEEEKAAKLQALREKAALKKAEQAKQDVIERRRNEELMMKRDKEHRKLAEEQKQKEAMKDAEKRRREAREDVLAKKKILAQIEADRKARQAAKAEASGAAPAPAAKPAAAPKPAPPAHSRPDYIVSNLRFRLPGQAAPYTKTYPVDVPVKDVIDDVSSQSGIPASRVVLMLTFPTRKLTIAQGDQTLKEAGLINSIVMVKEE
ncbi:hypothetical protein TRVA0_034S00100 [Trichomonascus vanleenenianus]|uniref:uncharacterized protein n=1 Tax=Trichomonascus vanleenenianus TaxID=2268995 RepID=UPI003ECB16C1